MSLIMELSSSAKLANLGTLDPTLRQATLYSRALLGHFFSSENKSRKKVFHCPPHSLLACLLVLLLAPSIKASSASASTISSTTMHMISN